MQLRHMNPSDLLQTLHPLLYNLTEQAIFLLLTPQDASMHQPRVHLPP